MNTKKIAFFLVFTLLFGVGNFAYGVSEDRYYIKTNARFWRNSLGVRNSFEGGFTTDASAWQLRLTRIFGIEVEKVQKLHILPSLSNDEDKNDIVAKPEIPQRGKSSKNIRPLPADQLPWGVRAIYGDNLPISRSGGEGVNIAVLDTGVDKNHIDLSGRVILCKDFSNRKQPIIDGVCDDKNGHGTHVAGIVAADSGSDGKGIFGIAPGVNLYAYRVCGNNGSCWADDVANAIIDATDNGTNIINLSIGGDTKSSLISDAVSYASNLNVLVVGAAGNDGPYLDSIDYPAANASVVAVGAIDTSFDIPEWSSRGMNSSTKPYVVEEKDIEFASPGVNIESTWKDGGYVILSGTSMATPHISGLSALLWQKNADEPANATREVLHKFSNDILPFGDDDSSGWGFSGL
jgi:subtilisin